MTHDELVQRAIKWLKGTMKCSAIASEMPTASWEIPDAIGWNTHSSWLIECKTSRSDFRVDLEKPFRRFPAHGVGNYRYYMTKPGLLHADEIPEGWGLLEVRPRTVRHLIKAKRFNETQITLRERPMLVSLIRKLTEAADAS